MSSIRGRTSRKTVLTQRGIVCVRGVRKLRLVIATASTIVRMFMRNVKSRYAGVQMLTAAVADIQEWFSVYSPTPSIVSEVLVGLYQC